MLQDIRYVSKKLLPLLAVEASVQLPHENTMRDRSREGKRRVSRGGCVLSEALTR